MHMIRKRTTSVLLTLLMLCIAVLGGCGPRPDSPAATTAAPFTEESSADYEHYEEQKLTAQKEFDRQMDELFRDEVSTNQIDLHFMLKDPSAYGISSAQNFYTSLSLEEMNKTLKERRALEAQLDAFEPALLTYDQKLTLRVLQSYLRTESMADGLELYYQPLAPTIGIQAQLPVLLSEYLFYRKQDVEDYLNLISGIDEYYQSIMDFEKRKAEAGLMMSDSVIDHVIESCESYLLVPGNNFMIDTFNTRLDSLDGLTEEEKETYRQQNAALLESDFVPAYQLLIDGLTALKGTGTNDQGLCGFPRGKEYYKYLVYSATGTSYASVDALLEDVEKTMKESLQETSMLLKDHKELLNEIDTYSFRQTEPDAIMEELKTLSQQDYPPLPVCSYTMKTVPKALELSLSPAFYLVSPLDDYQNNVIYINQNPRFAGSDLYTTIAHEGYPGHLYQNVYFHSSNAANIRKLLSFPGYAEGWASYVERESYTMNNGLKPEMGQLLAANSSASLGLHACLDIYINYKGWTKDQVRDYLKNYYDQPDDVAEALYSAMIENPSNYLSYYVGCMEIRNMRKAAENQLKDQFDLKAFHTFLLDMGDAPFDVIQAYFTTWLTKQKL